MDNRISFTAFLRDEYTKNFDRLVSRTDSGIKKVEKDLHNLGSTGKKTARSIDDINKRLEVLTRVRRITVDTSAIKFANQEIKALLREKAKLEGGGRGGFFGGMGGMGGFGSVAGAMGLGFGTAALVRGVIGAGTASVEASMEREQQRIMFEVLTGSASKGNNMLGAINEKASGTPFSSNDLIKATQTMLSFGVAQEKVLPIMSQLGDISGGNAERLQSLALAYSQVSSAGRLTGNDLLQMVNAGFNPLQIIAEKTGKKMGDLKKAMEDGKVSVDDVTAAIKIATSEGGRYFGMMDKQSLTTAGRLGTLQDNAHELAVLFGDRMKPALDAGIDGLSSMIATVREWMEVPVSEKISGEITQLRVLQSELTNANTTEERRKQILLELEKINPRITDGISTQNIEFEKLAANIDKVVSGLREKIAVDVLQKEYKPLLENYADLNTKREEKRSQIISSMVDLAPEIANDTSLTESQKIYATREKLRAENDKWNKRNPSLAKARGSSNEFVRLALFSTSIQQLEKLDKDIKNIEPQYSAFIKKRGIMTGQIQKMLGEPNATEGADGGKEHKFLSGSSSSKSSGGSRESSISGGSKITHLNISIQNLVSGGVNIHSTTLKEGAAQSKNIVVDALLTAVNDANLAAGR